MSLFLLGASRDRRTNRWEVTCPACGHRWEPPTTMFAKQEITCPAAKCGRAMVADYNAVIITLVEEPKS